MPHTRAAEAVGLAQESNARGCRHERFVRASRYPSPSSPELHAPRSPQSGRPAAPTGAQSGERPCSCSATAGRSRPTRRMRPCGSTRPLKGHSGELRPRRCSQSGELSCQPVAQLVSARRTSGGDAATVRRCRRTRAIRVGAATATCRTAVLPSARSCERRATNVAPADGAAINEACDRRVEFGAKVTLWRTARSASARRRQASIGLAASQRIASARLALSDRPNVRAKRALAACRWRSA